MSKYIKLEDALNCVNGYFLTGVHKAIKSLPTNEVSEDAISNGAISSDYIEGYREAVQRLEKFYLGEANAPSVAPTERREK